MFINLNRSFSRCLSTAPSSWNVSPAQFNSSLRSQGLSRVALLRNESGAFISANSSHDSLAAELSQHHDFLNHEAVFIEAYGTDQLFLVGVHSTKRGQACGGIRLWKYDSVKDSIIDAVRLATGMARKSALAGLWVGGGKGVICSSSNQTLGQKRQMFQDYGRFVSSLHGLYIGAEDVGMRENDMNEILTTTRFVTCISPSLGGSGNPSRPTALGVVAAMESALHHRGEGDLKGKTVAMQGLGNVATFMIEKLFSLGVARVIGSDVNANAVAEAQSRFAAENFEARLVSPQDNSVLEEQADILAPNALGGIITKETAPRIRAGIICGAANNQLLLGNEESSLPAGTTYVPDFVANRMGIVNCANENFGSTGSIADPSIEQHFSRACDNSVFNIVETVLKRAADEQISNNAAAEQLADELIQEDHPLIPGRCDAIRLSLVKDEWVKGTSFNY